MFHHLDEKILAGEGLQVFVRLAYSDLQFDQSVVELFPQVVYDPDFFVHHDLLLGRVVYRQHDSLVSAQDRFALLDRLL